MNFGDERNGVSKYMEKEKPQKYKRLLTDTLIFAIGNLGSKVILFFMVPLFPKNGSFNSNIITISFSGYVILYYFVKKSNKIN